MTSATSGLASRDRASRDLAHDLAVTAGAGAGKTTVLVDRFVAIARDPELGPDRVLALTFTRKAAVEMKERAIRVFEASHEADLRRRTEAAYISTIHGFAERVLRERPLDARIDPEFSVLTEYDQALFVEEALRAMYAREDLCSFTRRLGKRFGGGWKVFSLTREVARLIREGPEAAAREELLLDDGDDAFVARTLERARAYVRERESHAVACLQRLLPVLDGASFKSHGKLYAQSRDYMASAQACVECGSLAGALEILGKTPFTGAIVEDDRQPVKDLLAPVKETVKLISGTDWTAQEYLERELLPLKRAIYGATREISDTYAVHKQRLGALDFHDLQLRALELLSGNDRIRHEYADRFRHVLLDEAQDTDELQYGIIRLFDTPGNTLFMVGDPKQAIYGFRGADPDVFHAALERLPARDRLQLTENFRSRPEIIAFVNGVGPALLGERFSRIVSRADYGGEWLDVSAVTALYAIQGRTSRDSGSRTSGASRSRRTISSATAAASRGRTS
ncbi:MAG TPA: UvrD-helicase domain-containing protein, partial [Gemmatimonadaceae bacterium]